MSEFASSPLKEKHLELRERIRHPTGNWQPLDLQRVEISIPERFAELARAAPDRLAIYDPGTSFTYSALDQAANNIAQAILAKQGPGTEAIALLMGVDASAATAALGILKAGKCYTALEPSFPEKRMAQILADADVGLILTDAAHLALARQAAGSERQILQIEQVAGGDAPDPSLALSLDAPAILNYTSGSTGVPKGVLQSHASAFAQAVRYAASYRVSDADRLACFGSLAWAGPFWDIFGPLCLGGSTGPFDLRQLGPDRLEQWLQETAPTIVAGLMAVRQIVHTSLERQFLSVRVVHMGGDTIYRRDVEACLRVFPNATIAVGLGLSEAGRVTELLLDSTERLDQDVVPLGFPLPGLRLKLISEEGTEVARGEVGEIVVLGPHLAAGYWRRPDLTAERFRSAGLLGEEPAYLTGDLARQRPDGSLQHVGRKHHMVKIRGYQVYTNEIEALLREVEGVREACVTTAHTLHDGAQRLVAYLVVDRQSFPGARALHGQFAGVPHHMAPQSYVFLDALPRTPTGKIDRQRLPLPERSRLNVTAGYVAPRNPTETLLAALWAKVLGIDGIGVHDSFVELGGDSLESTRIINRVRAGFGVDISLQAFFEAQTIAKMATILQLEGPDSVPDRRSPSAAARLETDPG